jgi:hypothetical protein
MVHHHLNITEGIPKYQPPLTIDQVKYALEVTSVVSDYGYDARCQELEREIESEAKNDNILKGNYVLCIMGKPNIPKKFTKDRKDLLEKALGYIRDTVSQFSAKKLKIYNESRVLKIIHQQKLFFTEIKSPEWKQFFVEVVC